MRRRGAALVRRGPRLSLRLGAVRAGLPLTRSLRDRAAGRGARADEFRPWFEEFAGNLFGADGRVVLEPVAVRDPTDGHFAHLLGLNLSRAAQLFGLARKLGADERAAALRESAQRHLAAGLPFADGGDFVVSHWLATFALRALEARQNN
ncbi:DUF2891 domain-containing protein [Saccharopolyspora sp. K220]|nr:DUF2891 family protein [Saccharopolyspora soli]MCI2416999.1 DUF2891 domain-containing protein [Saccharopolyspora soli]